MSRSNPKVQELCDLYQAYADDYYRAPDGLPTREAFNVRDALRPLRRLHGRVCVASFRPAMLRAVQDAMAAGGKLCRKTINARINRIRRMFRWAVAYDLAPDTLPHALATVAPLKLGRCKAPESPGVRCVDEALVMATADAAPPILRAMILLQWHTGMRSGELCRIRSGEIERTSKVWLYRPARHKTQHHAIERVIPLGPSARRIIAPILGMRLDRDRPLFPYCTQSYRQAIHVVCRRHGLPRWKPGQIRHSVATRLRKLAGLEAARVVLGHTSAATTEIYAELDIERAVSVMARHG